jgi:hypothetical protein
MTPELILLAIAAVSLTLSVWLGRRRGCESCGTHDDLRGHVCDDCWRGVK